MASRLGRFAYRFRWFVIAAWLVVFAVSAIFAPRVTSVLKGGGYSIPASQADKAYNAISRAYGYRALAFTAVFQEASPASTRSLTAAGLEFRARVERRFGRLLQSGPVVGTGDGRVVFVRLYTRPRSDFGIPLTARIRPLLPAETGVRGYLTGASAIFYDMEKVSDADLKQMEIVTFPIALAVLLLIFGTVIGAFVPVSMGPLTVTAALATVFFLGHAVDMSIFVLNTASMLGLGVAIDYSLFMVQRFREELANGLPVEDAVVRTVSTSGVAILVSALTVAIGFLGMTLFHVTMLTSLGIGGSVVVAISMVAALTLVPAVLGVLGARVNSLSILPRSISSEGFWRRLATTIMSHPWRTVLAVLAIIVVIALPGRAMRVGIPGPDILPTNSPSRVGDTILQRHIGIADQSPVLVVLESHSFRSASTRLGLYDLAAQICRRPIVAGVSALPVVNAPRDIVSCGSVLRRLGSGGAALANRDVALISLFLRADPSSTAAEQFVTYLRHLPAPPGVRVLVGGQTAAQLDFNQFLYGRFPLAVLFVVLAIFAVLAVAFRSVVLPVKAVLMNGLSVLAAYGATVFVFQDGYLRSIFGFTPTGFLDSIVPVFIFCVLFGISTDYEVFLLARVREEYVRTGKNTASVATGLEKTGRMITSAASIMVVIFAAFSFANLVVIKELGFAMAVGVLIDATLIRALLVPAAMRILGSWNWWPGVRGGVPLAHPGVGTHDTLLPVAGPG